MIQGLGATLRRTGATLRRAAAPRRPSIARPAGRGAWGPARDLALPGSALIRDAQILPSADGPPKTADAVATSRFGGPVWPAGFEESPLRFRARGFVADRMLPPVERPEAVIDRPCAWGGYLHHHFGHLVAEHLGRVLWSRRAWPGLPLLFIARPDLREDRLLPHVRDVLGWYGVAPDALHVVRVPTLARELFVAPQAEAYRTEAPTPAYLDLLDDHVARSGLAPEPSGLLYVTRAGILRTLRGGHVGEGYLARLLAEAGVRVLDPGAVPLRAQLAAYAGARHLIFAEGSAVHGRQLLGRLDQDITVVNRRDRAGLARQNLKPRCRSLAYVAPNRASVTPVLPGRIANAFELAFYDVPALLDAFAAMGLDLAPRWDHGAYRAACEADLSVWTAAMRSDPQGRFDVPATLEALSRTLALRPLDPA